MMLLRNDEYWIKHAEKRMDEYMCRADKTAEEISFAYKEMLDKLIDPLDSIYSGLTVGVSVSEAKRILNNMETINTEKAIYKAADKIKNPDQKAEMLNYLIKPIIKEKIIKLSLLISKIKTACREIIKTTVKQTDDCLNCIIPEAYYKSSYDLQKGTNIGMLLPFLEQEEIDEIRLTNWSGRPYVERIKTNSLKLSNLLIAELFCGFLTKKNKVRMSEEIAIRISEAFNRSYALLRTEACFAANQGEMCGYKAHGVEKYRYVAVLDMKTSKICRELDGKEFNVDKAIIGINFPPLHPRCRSTTRPVINGEDLSRMERNATDPKTGEQMNVPADMSYSDWKSKYIDKSGESGIIKKGSDEMGLSLKIDKFTPCLIEKATGNIVNTKYSIATDDELKLLKNKGWNFDWTADDLKDAIVYKLILENDDSIQGLVALKDMPNDYAVYLKLAESAPQNIGNNRNYEGVGGHLFAIAAQTSVDNGYGGFIYFEAKNIELVQHYQETFRGKLIGGVHQYRMIIDEDAAKELLSKYTLKGE